jgi:hypothetical protein
MKLVADEKVIVMKEIIERAIYAALETLIRDDYELLLFDINERSISHRFAKYLEPYFPGWNIDCEYNRNHYNPKRLNINPRIIRTNDTQARTVFPDIIIHRRGSDENLVAIEIKKTSNRENDSYDLAKLKAFKNQLGYRFVIFIKIKTGQHSGIERIEFL